MQTPNALPSSLPPHIAAEYSAEARGVILDLLSQQRDQIGKLLRACEVFEFSFSARDGK